MRNQVKKELLERLSAQTEQHLAYAIETVQNLPADIVTKPGAGNGWSAVQCMEHLNRYGIYYLPEISKAILKARKRKNSDVFSSSWLGHYFTSMMDPVTGAKKIKAFKDYVPLRDLNAAAVTAEYIRQLEQLTTLLDQSSAIDLTASRIPVSIAWFIRLKLGDVLQFVVAHNERHFRQMQRAMEK